MESKFSNLPGRISTGVDSFYIEKRQARCRLAIAVRLVAVVIGVVIGLTSYAIQAQTRIRYVQISAAGGPPSDLCKQEGELVQSYAGNYPHVDRWTWIVACDEFSWRALLQHVGIDQSDRMVFAATDRAHRFTYVRGFALLHPPDNFAVVPEHVIAHEIAHAYLDTADEALTESQVRKWEKDRSRKLLAVSNGGSR
jgi:hypothetical protein